MPEVLLSEPKKVFRYYDLVMAAFVTVLICSNVIGAGKVATISLPLFGDFTFGAGVLFFPISYIFGDILTEVYGYARARKVVWTGFGAMIFASIMCWFVVRIPPAQGWTNQAAYETCFGATPRIVAASLLAFCVGEFVNSYTLAKMKIWTDGRHLWSRVVGSTVAGEFVDSLVFYPAAFYGVWPDSLVTKVMLTNYMLKVVWEVVNTPITYRVVSFLKLAENEDYYDRNTDFTPFSLKT
ncbi:MAG: queuosine precursor transporter [Deltaproteobacteria bacterium]|nr:queuosine precursor transporter [Deltaproteobacteria bacterium]